MNAEEMIREFPKGLINWYPFLKNSSVLMVSDAESVLQELLAEKCKEVQCKTVKEVYSKDFQSAYPGYFDYILLVGVVEKLESPSAYLSDIKRLLHREGHLLIGAENRLGIKYFCGDRDPFTGRSFDGVEHYKEIVAKDKENFAGRCYSKDELMTFLVEAGFGKNRFYSVFPNLDAPQLIYGEDYLPVEELAIRYFPKYNYPDSVFLEEEYLYTDLVKNGLFHAMANAYLIDCCLEETYDKILHVTLSMDRGEENSMVTIIRETEEKQIVEKKPLYPQGMSRLEELVKNAEDLNAHGIKVIDAKVQDESYVMPYMEADTAMNFMRQLAKTDLEAFIREMDRFRELILQSSEHVRTDEELGIILKRAYVDMVPLNCFYLNGEYLFYDQEFYEENYPANMIIYRMIVTVYMSTDKELESILGRRFFLERYGLFKNLDTWQRMEREFSFKLRNIKALSIYAEKYQRNNAIVNSNRQKLNYSQEDYRKKFIDIFKNIENKKLILFGSGAFARRFLVQFKKDYPVYAIVDNNETSWGKELEGITIHSPDILNTVDKKEICIIICVKNYMGIVRQLERMGYNDYRIYDYNIDYPRKQQVISERVTNAQGAEGEVSPQKKYHTGYVAGVFDLFHVGHLNMFKRAKEQCEYLIVGVVSDEVVRKNKKTEPFVPFEERIEMVRSCRYVDEAVEVPIHCAGTKEAYKMYQFDCQFSGSDYVNDPVWLSEKEYLQKQGSDLVFFPYTESTSSSKLKAMINKKLM